MKLRARSLALTLTLALGAIACGGDPVADETEKIVEDAEQERSDIREMIEMVSIG